MMTIARTQEDVLTACISFYLMNRVVKDVNTVTQIQQHLRKKHIMYNIPLNLEYNLQKIFLEQQYLQNQKDIMIVIQKWMRQL